ncbi:MAG: ABC transporter ATP-binding protein, partial [Treponema sp.]|nr:ABC transporter ATP-binding protein [Treponema sp.]
SSAQNQLSYEEQKALRAQKSKMEKEVARLEQEITKAENEKKTLENQMANPEVYSNGEKCRVIQQKISELDKILESLNEQWETAAEALG